MAIDRRYIQNLKGKDFVLWAGLLDAATGAGLRSIEVNLLQYPASENGNLAVAQATVTFEDGRVFTEIGDAGPQNCAAMIAVHACRMAATRAKGRALRDALNIAETMLEELGPDGDGENGHRSGLQSRTGVQRAAYDPEDNAARKAAEAPPEVCTVCGADVPKPVAVAARKEFGTVVCAAHGRERRSMTVKPAPAQLTGA